MDQDLAHKRPWLLISLVFGITYPLASVFHIPGIWAMAWKGASAAFLVPYALRRHHSGDFVLLAAMLALCALGDVLVEIQLEFGALAFAAAHVVSIYIYMRHRWVKPSLSQTILAIALFTLTPFIAYFLAGSLPAFYAVLLGGMAAMAWSSNFPRYRVGIGAALFVASDMLLFAREGGIAPANGFTGNIVWYSYYCGIFMIATGIVQTLIKRGHYEDAAGF